ncbi:MAG: hypothetical protein AMS26_20415 [Bacteroides sp. SM23_62]|nr:MAG: hypothetical protein AMS26_20415 [Bacteroides sp. SM23_62]
MKLKTLLFVFAGLLITGSLIAQDIIVIDGGLANAGELETTINGDTASDGSRLNPNRIYELKAGEYYIQNAPINVNNPDGTIIIRGQTGGTKPIWVKTSLEEVNVGSNQIASSLTMQNIHYQTMQMDNRALPWSAFNITVDSAHLLVEDCLVEFCNGIIWNMNNVSAGAELEIRNSYFRDFHDFTQWWQARVAQCKVPVDKFIFENNTVTGGGLTVLGQECLFEYAVINHNTFINNHKYPFLNQYWKEVYFTNNLFVNANMVGEDMENVATGGQDPDGLMHGISGVDTITLNIWIQGKFLNEDSTALTEEVDELSDIIYYAADNVVTYSPTLDFYYGGGYNDNTEFDAPESYLDWGGMGTGPWEVVNVPGIWSNSRTQDLIAAYSNIVDENNEIYTISLGDLGLGTDPLPQAAADTFVKWNRNQWGVPDITTIGDPGIALYAFGDYDPATVPGVEVEAAPPGAGGITKISDMIEDFSYSMTLTSKSDGLRIGALHWNDETYDGAASIAAVKAAYDAATDIEDVLMPAGFDLKNYPNPFNSSTTISFNLEKNSHVNLSVYDISGRRVELLINENRIAGEHHIQFSPDQVSSNIYFLRLTTEDNTVTKKMMMLK